MAEREAIQTVQELGPKALAVRCTACCVSPDVEPPLAGTHYAIWALRSAAPAAMHHIHSVVAKRVKRVS